MNVELPKITCAKERPDAAWGAAKGEAASCLTRPAVAGESPATGRSDMPTLNFESDEQRGAQQQFPWQILRRTKKQTAEDRAR